MADLLPWPELPRGRECGRPPVIGFERGDGNLVVSADIFGIKPEDMRIEVEDDILAVSGPHRQAQEWRLRDFP